MDLRWLWLLVAGFGNDVFGGQWWGLPVFRFDGEYRFDPAADVGGHRHFGGDSSLRHYVRARELKATGMDWTDILGIEEKNPRA